MFSNALNFFTDCCRVPLSPRQARRLHFRHVQDCSAGQQPHPTRIGGRTNHFRRGRAEVQDAGQEAEEHLRAFGKVVGAVHPRPRLRQEGAALHAARWRGEDPSQRIEASW